MATAIRAIIKKILNYFLLLTVLILFAISTLFFSLKLISVYQSPIINKQLSDLFFSKIIHADIYFDKFNIKWSGLRFYIYFNNVSINNDIQIDNIYFKVEILKSLYNRKLEVKLAYLSGLKLLNNQSLLKKTNFNSFFFKQNINHLILLNSKIYLTHDNIIIIKKANIAIGDNKTNINIIGQLKSLNKDARAYNSEFILLDVNNKIYINIFNNNHQLQIWGRKNKNNFKLYRVLGKISDFNFVNSKKPYQIKNMHFDIYPINYKNQYAINAKVEKIFSNNFTTNTTIINSSAVYLDTDINNHAIKLKFSELYINNKNFKLNINGNLDYKLFGNYQYLFYSKVNYFKLHNNLFNINNILLQGSNYHKPKYIVNIHPNPVRLSKAEILFNNKNCILNLANIINLSGEINYQNNYININFLGNVFAAIQSVTGFTNINGALKINPNNLEDFLILIKSDLKNLKINWPFLEKKPANRINFQVKLYPDKLNMIFDNYYLLLTKDEFHNIHGRFNLPMGSGYFSNSKEQLNIFLKQLTLDTTRELFDIPIRKVLAYKEKVFLNINKLIINNKSLHAVTLKSEAIGNNKKHIKIFLVNNLVELDFIAANINTNSNLPINLNGSLRAKNLEALLKTIGFNPHVNKTKVYLTYNLNWMNKLLLFNSKYFTGEIKFLLENGFLLDLNPGIAKLLNIFSLDNMQRRLKLDFSDLTKKGFLFDHIYGKLKLQQGILDIIKANINGPAADIYLLGVIDLLKHQYDLGVEVAPKVSNSLPIALALASGNPAVGALVWLLDKLLQFPVNKINRDYYLVTGSWFKPYVNKLRISQPINFYNLISYNKKT